VSSMSFVPIDYPREVLELSSSGDKGWRRMVKNADELESYWRGKNGSGNVYFTAYGYTETQAPKHHRVDYNTPLIHHFVMDFDCKDFNKNGADVAFEKPQEEVQRLHQFLMKENTLHYVWFSGGGYHVWIPLSESLVPQSGGEVSRIKTSGRVMIKQWEKEIGALDCNDPTVLFDTSGMIRIPNSYNAKRGAWSVPLTSHQLMTLSYDDLMNKGMESHRGYIPLGENKLLMKIVENKFSENFDLKPVELPTVALNDIHILPCLSQAAMGGGNPPHRARYHFASYLADRFRMFFPAWRVPNEEKEKHVQNIVSICEQQEWVDYRYEKTEEQVRSIVMTGYSHATCSTLYTEGFCMGKCKYYDGTGVN